MGTLGPRASCVTHAALLSLQLHVHPRRVWLLAAEAGACERVAAEHAPHLDVRCVAEDSVVEGVSRAKVDAFLEGELGGGSGGSGSGGRGGRRSGGRSGGSDGDGGAGGALYAGRSLGGWYMQQLLKLGAAGSAALPGLSNSFLVWDMDMIALRPPSFITARWRAGSTGVAVTLLHAGGNAVGSYDAAVLSLAGVPSARAADGSSLVANAMLFRTEVVKELREAMGGEQDAAWAWAALAAAVRAPDPKLGFSEYQTYASWLLARRPQEAQIVGGRSRLTATFWRHPIGAEDLFARLGGGGSDGDGERCCPSAAQLWWSMLAGYQYVGWERGHQARCRALG